MNKLHEDLKTYLYQTLNVRTELHPYENQGNLPFFLTNAYIFFEISLFKQPCLLMIAQENKEITPGMIRKHLEQVEKIWEGSIIIYVQSILSSFNRKRLIEQHIPFIIPGNQMYLPHFGIDLREHFRKIQTRKQKTFTFSPGTQTAVIYALFRETDEKLTPSELADKLNYTLMTMTRALDELQVAGIGEFRREGRERYWIFSNKHSLWNQARPFLRSPIKKRIWINNHQFKTLAGLSALSHFSQLAPPALPVFAIGYNQWVELKQSGLEVLPISEGASSELEIWNYNPELFAKDGVIDPFSLFLCLEASGDERIESALEELMEKIKW